MENELPKDFSWDEIGNYAEVMNGNFYVALSNMNIAFECSSRGIKYYYKYSATSLYELQALKENGVSYVLIAAPLMFDLKSVGGFAVPVRAIANLAYEPYLGHQNGIIGGWIRPEDVDKYGQYIDTLEFYAPKALDKEAALFHVYAENKTWPGNLNLLIDFLNFDSNNKVIYDETNFAIRRMNCKQKCLSGKSCHYCYDQLNSESLVRKYRDYKNTI